MKYTMEYMHLKQLFYQYKEYIYHAKLQHHILYDILLKKSIQLQKELKEISIILFLFHLKHFYTSQSFNLSLLKPYYIIFPMTLVIFNSFFNL